MKQVAIYARVSTDKQQTSNQVLVLKEITERSRTSFRFMKIKASQAVKVEKTDQHSIK